MSYRVEYNISGNTKVVNTDRERRYKWMGRIACVFVICAVLIHGIVSKWIWDVLFPGYNETTVSAADNMIAQIRDGEPIGDAVTAFCKEIIANGQE